MKPTDFAKHLTAFFQTYLTSQKNVSKNTIYSYLDTFKLFLRYCQEVKQIPAERLELNLLTNDLITGFLDWLESERNAASPRETCVLRPSIPFFGTYSTRSPRDSFISKKQCPSL
ncbi:site-specific integrase [Paenibacillus sp. FSL P2-0136]|uniref:site-specific integrase n=1 Tax=Paenibacillus sp. FSL P2-0136 TaxID=2975317 RepID=UPI0030DA4177